MASLLACFAMKSALHAMASVPDLVLSACWKEQLVSDRVGARVLTCIFQQSGIEQVENIPRVVADHPACAVLSFWLCM